MWQMIFLEEFFVADTIRLITFVSPFFFLVNSSHFSNKFHQASSQSEKNALSANEVPLSVYQKPLALFSKSPMTGFFRDGYCRVGPQDGGNHAVAGMYDYLPFSSISTAFKFCLRHMKGREKKIEPLSLRLSCSSFISVIFLTSNFKSPIYALSTCPPASNNWTADEMLPGVLTREFLDFSASRGNNLRSIGLEPGCKWCLCTARWKEALDARKSDDDPVVPKYA